MASTLTDPMALRQSIEVPADRPRKEPSKRGMLIEMPSAERAELEQRTGITNDRQYISQDNCDGKHDGVDAMITMDSTSKVAGQTVAPFLARHIPEQYAPLGAPQPAMATQKDPNTKYCYRHRPDSKCRRTADEPTMENLQRVCWIWMLC
jgi:F-box and WD-40 domain protein MET30